MKTIDLFARVGEQVLQDAQVHRYGSVLLARGVGGLARLNPTAVWVDAAIAVIEAGTSYLRYCAAQEVTAQLKAFNEQLEKTLANELKIGRIELERLRREGSGRRANIEQLLKVQGRAARLTKAKIGQQLDSLTSIHKLLQQERQAMGSFQELIGLQVCLDSCIDATLALLLSPTGETQ
ncbi:hypothetical protein CF344_17900 [Pseudomonas aeruginosa]|uniref:Uncharacterized protein n=1 Tax=Pseudomonas tohonis TaxID=2725477 RepID=A0ABQ4W6K1_9PSED|nr:MULTISPECIES: hypothetical protein [Pseudomonas]OXT66094.1 hypothetical protein CF344_17900 [Pseudomonas aeruginosa]GJN55086.1 hypothetical protein TUM20286_48380 [Pseudomonas tohonis]